MFSWFTKDEGFSFAGGISVMEPLEGRRLLSAAGVDDNPHIAPKPDDYGGRVYWNGSETVDELHDGVIYNCHDYAWLGGGNGWINDPTPALGPPHSEPVAPGGAAVGDIVIYGIDKDGDGVIWGANEITHSAVVTAVDENGLIVEVDGKEGNGPISTHHPADPNPTYGELAGVYRPTNPPDGRIDKGNEPVPFLDWVKGFCAEHGIDFAGWLQDLKDELDAAGIDYPDWLVDELDNLEDQEGDGDDDTLPPEMEESNPLAPVEGVSDRRLQSMFLNNSTFFSESPVFASIFGTEEDDE